jgi:hypothetical protein
MSNPLVTIIQWIDFVHNYQKKVKEQSTTLSFIPTLSYKHIVPEYKKLLYKCKWGSTCFQPTCIYMHPGQKEYEKATYYKNNIACKYETRYTSCKNKCGHTDGKYCPFMHCTHMNNNKILCLKPRCQQHCNVCL